MPPSHNPKGRTICSSGVVQRVGRRIGRLLTVVACLVMVVSTVGCSRPEEVSRRPRVSIYGVDGATWAVIDPLLEKGDLPTMAKMIEDGVRAPFRSIKPLVSPPVWTTIATGVPRAQHGITRFLTFGQEARKRAGGHLVSSRDRRAHALWTMATQRGLRSAVLGWWATYPAESINGVIVSERALKTRESDIEGNFYVKNTDGLNLVYPDAALPRLIEIINDGPDDNGDPHDKDRVLRAMIAEDTALARALTTMRSDYGPFDLELVLMRGVDVISHHFWKFHEPDSPAYEPADRPTKQDVARLGDTVTNQYRLVDRLIGKLTEDDRAGDVVLIISDHGFEAGMQPFRKGQLSGTHTSDDALNGILIAAGGPFRKGVALEQASILDITPTVLHLLGLPITKAMPGKVLVDAIEPQWLAANQINEIGKYDDPPVLLDGDFTSDESVVDEAVLEQLRALGYVE